MKKLLDLCLEQPIHFCKEGGVYCEYLVETTDKEVCVLDNCIHKSYISNSERMIWEYELHE